MKNLKFDKNELTNLEYSLSREFISNNRAGGYMSTTITCCNTRKYHGLMVCPIDDSGLQNYVLLSSLDETVIQQGQSFNLAIHDFSNVFSPKGHKYIISFDYTPTPTIIYRVGGVVLKKELLWLHSKQRLLVRYTLLEATSDTKLRLSPLLAFRNIHSLSVANMEADGSSKTINGGVKCKLYSNFPFLHLQINKENDFYPAPDWHYGFHYSKEQERGYESFEDLLTPGLFELDIKKGESIVVSCSLNQEPNTATFEDEFNNELARRSDKIEFWSCLRHSARQFIVKQGDDTVVIAGYPWFEKRGRDALMSSTWLTLTQGREDLAMDIFTTIVKMMQGGRIPCFANRYESADTSLWFFNSMQQFENSVGAEVIWNDFGGAMRTIIDAYSSKLQDEGIEFHQNGLLWTAKENVALTWMDMYADGVPVTPRSGYAIEINAMWYNAICYTLSLAQKFGDEKFVEQWKDWPAKIKQSYHDLFWIKERGYYADYVDDHIKNMQIRPNQLIGCALPFSVSDNDEIKAVLDTVDKYLLTNKGIRTLAPNDPQYKGYYGGDVNERALEHHQGCTRAWFLPYYFAANISIYGVGFMSKANELIEAFEDDFLNYGIGTISELCTGNPPHKPEGSVSQAISVGAILRMKEMLVQRVDTE